MTAVLMVLTQADSTGVTMDRHLDMTMAGPWDVPMVVSRASTTVVLTAKTMDMTMDLSWAY